MVASSSKNKGRGRGENGEQNTHGYFITENHRKIVPMVRNKILSQDSKVLQS